MRTANGVSAVMIIYRAKNPREIFIEMKDDGHPIKLVRRQLCFIGGNWIGAGALNDRSPYDTACREVVEELSFDRPMQDTRELELALLGVADRSLMIPPPRKGDEQVADVYRETLATIKEDICRFAKPLVMTLNTVSKEAILAADPTYQRDGVSGLCCYFTVGLSEFTWTMLVRLQAMFGNLSNESITMITSLNEICERGIKTAFAHDHALRHHFAACGFAESSRMPMTEGATSELISPVPESYEQLLTEWHIIRRPTAPVAS